MAFLQELRQDFKYICTLMPMKVRQGLGILELRQDFEYLQAYDR
jgi:hypothetical protein